MHCQLGMELKVWRESWKVYLSIQGLLGWQTKVSTQEQSQLIIVSPTIRLVSRIS